MPEPVIAITDLSVRYGEHEALHDVTFTVEAGEIVAVIGPNGSGKTTLVRAMLGLVPSRGEIKVFGESVKNFRRVAHRVGYVPQRLDIDRTIPLSVAELLALFSRGKQNRATTERALDDVDAAALIDRPLVALSGGQFQRILLALALVGGPDLLVLDEPLAGVDVEGESVFYDVLKRLRERRNLTTLIISHDLSAVYRHATKVVCINHRMLCQGTPRDVLTHEMLEHIYGGSAFYAHET